MKRFIPEKYAVYFDKMVNLRMSFFDIKEDLLSIIKRNKWYANKDKSLIDLPFDLRVILDLPDDGLIRFSDIDKVVSLFYND